jgi:hypothetical protein
MEFNSVFKGLILKDKLQLLVRALKKFRSFESRTPAHHVYLYFNSMYQFSISLQNHRRIRQGGLNIQTGLQWNRGCDVTQKPGLWCHSKTKPGLWCHSKTKTLSNYRYQAPTATGCYPVTPIHQWCYTTHPFCVRVLLQARDGPSLLGCRQRLWSLMQCTGRCAPCGVQNVQYSFSALYRG